MIVIIYTVWNVPEYGVFSGSNVGKYGPEKTLYLDTFYAVLLTRWKRVKLSFISSTNPSYFLYLATFQENC